MCATSTCNCVWRKEWKTNNTLLSQKANHINKKNTKLFSSSTFQTPVIYIQWPAANPPQKSKVASMPPVCIAGWAKQAISKMHTENK